MALHLDTRAFTARNMIPYALIRHEGMGGSLERVIYELVK